MKYLAALGLCALLTSCVPPGGGGDRANKPAPASWKTVPGVTSTVNGMREVLKAKVNDRDVVAVLTWRNYNSKLDAGVTTWYGDMGSPPPKFVVESLLISIDGRGVIVPRSKTHYLASQWMNGTKSLGLVMKDKNPCVFVDLGDGGESWTAVYVVNSSTGALISHELTDGPEFHDRLIP